MKKLENSWKFSQNIKLTWRCCICIVKNNHCFPQVNSPTTICSILSLLESVTTLLLSPLPFAVLPVTIAGLEGHMLGTDMSMNKQKRKTKQLSHFPPTLLQTQTWSFNHIVYSCSIWETIETSVEPRPSSYQQSILIVTSYLRSLDWVYHASRASRRWIGCTALWRGTSQPENDKAGNVVNSINNYSPYSP